MRILIAHNEYAKPSGEEHAIRTIAGLLEGRGHEVKWFLRSSAEIAGSPSGRIQSFFSGIYSRDSRRRIEHLLDEQSFDLVQVQNLYPLLSPSILKPCRRRGIPVVMRCPNYRLFCPNGLLLSHGTICERCLGGKEWWCVLRNCEGDLFKSFGYALRNANARRLRMILDNVTSFIVLSEFQRQRFIAAGIEPNRIEIVPNFDPTPNDAVSLPAGSGETISFIGRISPEKGIGDFLAAARALSGAPFSVAGDTSRMPDIICNVPDNVHFHGFISGSELHRVFCQTRILVMPSVCYEGFPNVVIKAMFSGKPVLAARLGAMSEIVHDGVTGLLYEPGNLEDLISKLTSLLDQPDLCCKMGEAGRAKALNEYSGQTVYPRLMSAYENARALQVQGGQCIAV